MHYDEFFSAVRAWYAFGRSPRNGCSKVQVCSIYILSNAENYGFYVNLIIPPPLPKTQKEEEKNEVFGPINSRLILDLLVKCIVDLSFPFKLNSVRSSPTQLELMSSNEFNGSNRLYYLGLVLSQYWFGLICSWLDCLVFLVWYPGYVVV